MTDAGDAWRWDAATVSKRVRPPDVGGREVVDLDRDGYLDAFGTRSSVLRARSVVLDRYDVLPTATSWERQFPSRYREDVLLVAGEMIESRSGHDVVEQLPA